MIEKEKDLISISLGGVEQEIFFSFGIDTEITKAFTDMIRDGGNEEGSLITDTVGKIIADISSKKEDEVITSEDVSRMIELAFEDNAKNSVKVAGKIKKEATSYADAYSRICSLLLTVRDDKGKIVEPVLASEILFGKKYQTEEARKELNELFQYAQKRFAIYIEEVSSKN